MPADQLEPIPEIALEDRRAAVLRAIVEEYVSSAQPVASQRIVARRSIAVSSATVRNDMHALERDGFIAQPHTSAGRIPTDLGSRYYVDHLARTTRLGGAQQRAVRDFFDATHQAMEEVLAQTSQLLARITQHAAVVVPPQSEAATIRGIQVVEVGAGALLAVVVTSSGAVVRIQFPALERGAADPADLITASNLLTAHASGKTLGTSMAPIPATDGAVGVIISAVLAALAEVSAEDSARELFVGGASRIAGEDGFNQPSTVAGLLELLEHQYLVVSLARELINDGVSVRIGKENDEVALQDCSLVLAPYRIDGRGVGTVAILGPTRMDYPGAIAAVDSVSRHLVDHLSN